MKRNTVEKCRPTARQLEFQDWKFGIFLRCGIRTLSEGRRDRDGKPVNPSDFTPSHLDCNAWAKATVDAGAKYMVLTALLFFGMIVSGNTHTISTTRTAGLILSMLFSISLWIGIWRSVILNNKFNLKCEICK